MISNLISLAVRYLFDTSMVVAGLRSKRGASNALLRLAFQRRLPVVIHYELLAEYRDVLGRETHMRGTGLSEAKLQRFLAALVTVAQEITVRYMLRPNLPDADDDFIYELAFAASPCTIVTHNVRHFAAAELRWPGVSVKTPRQVLREVLSDA